MGLHYFGQSAELHSSGMHYFGPSAELQSEDCAISDGSQRCNPRIALFLTVRRVAFPGLEGFGRSANFQSPDWKLADARSNPLSKGWQSIGSAAIILTAVSLYYENP